MQSTIETRRSEMFQYESTDGGTTMSLYVDIAHIGGISRYLTVVFALAAFVFAGRLFRRRSAVF